MSHPNSHSPFHFYNDAFDEESILQYRSSSGSSSSSYGRYNLRDDDDACSMTSVDSSEHGVPKLEAYLYYFGLRGQRKLGPKLIYRSSTDVFDPPSGPFQEVRERQLLAVHEHAELGKDSLWPKIRGEVVQLLDKKDIQFTSVDLVRFRWIQQTEDGRGKTVTSPVTIWIGVFPDSTNGDAAFSCTQDIFKVLERHSINDIDIAYRESEAQYLSGPVLYAPVSDFHRLKRVIDWVTTPLSLPIAGKKTQHIQGTLGFYFKVGEELYGVTARHVLFPYNEINKEYRHKNSAPKKHVILMGGKVFDDYLASIQVLIKIFNGTVTTLKKTVTAYSARAAGGDQQAREKLVRCQQELDKSVATITALEKFHSVVKRDWSDAKNRIIGHVVWSPPLTGSNPPNGYTQDVCVIKLDKAKFLPNFRGNVIDLGTEISPGKFMLLLHPCKDTSQEFDYPHDRLYQLKAILAAANFKEPNSKDREGEPTRFVIKRGYETLTTVGRLNGFESLVRHYGLLGHIDSIEAAVHSYDSRSRSFSGCGDSGAAIVGDSNDFVALLTGGSGGDNSTDIAYGTPMEWLWNVVIKGEFPGAVLFINDPEQN